MASSRPPPSKPLDLYLTVVSAKHLKNVNWRSGDLKPYAIFWLDPDRKFATKPDDSGSTRPVWNESYTLPVPIPLHDAFLTLEIFHSKPSETPKPLVGTLRFPIKDLMDPACSVLNTLELRRPSGRPQGKIRVKLALRERPAAPTTPDYHNTPPSGYYYHNNPPASLPPPPPRDYRGYSTPPYSSPLPPPAPVPVPQYGYGNYSDPYSYYSGGYYSHSQAPPPPRSYFDRPHNYAGGPSAPVDFSAGVSNYDQKPKGGKLGVGSGLAVGAVAGVLGGLALEEGLKYEEEKIAERVESDLAARDDYSDYRGDY